ncbi:hypothetical protein [Microvirga subterranea]|uniref:DUF2490 domain-containing protein n=1 Tax=Microvirga subterranea TaxID=186651 RepID=A0A370HPJ5_9HYPH|nr:hypothetical protein [Microvirga subterranea]RDI60260.1 hypothetical protein DES45_103522 [Microvirga subterranea]
MPASRHSRQAALALMLLAPATAHAAEDEIWNAWITPSWLDAHVAALRSTPGTRRAYALNRTEIWASGIARSTKEAFGASRLDEAVGARLRPFQDIAFTVGTAIAHTGEFTRSLSSSVNWESSWSRRLKRLGGLKVDLTTAGAFGSGHTAYSQSISGTLGIPLELPLGTWTTELKLSPSMNLDMASGEVGTHLASELVGRTVLGSETDAFSSVLNLKIGYGFAPETRPSAFAGVEIRITPNL